ncbi:related to Drosophila pumilio protein and Mpt5p protein [Cephalotrichum gorgonifer]|uniref:Related to Drosophila pumilio protein and Mpt5p protein n=1 Tax=Cephalotrichum gorgonifer TaxID=2041049 RepID=A0AAE8N520_9PEZI|nr:related to Drosophila pumilio protein and Mpt5p protein [Cephalotrichum gorgonifer]
MIREQKRRFEAELQKHEQELAQMQEDLRGPFGGHQSEPTTPPEYRETSNGFPSIFSRPNRYSTSSLTSPPGIYNRAGRSGSQLSSPPAGILASIQPPSWSTPTTRRNSDEEDKDEAVRQDPTSHRSSNALNRYSMPVTRSRNGIYDLGGLDGTNTTRFLFGDDDLGDPKHTPTTTADQSFPTLVRRDDTMGLSAIGSGQLNGNTTSAKPANSFRHSLDLKYLSETTSDSILSSAGNHLITTPPKLQNSYSTGDVTSNKSNASQNFGNSPNNHAQQHFHNHNASLGRIPAGAMPTRHTRELSNDGSSAMSREHSGGYPSIQSTLQGGAAPFGPTMASPAGPNPNVGAPNQAPNGYPYYVNNNGYGPPGGPPGGPPSGPPAGPASTGAGNFGVPLLTMGLQNMNVNGYPSGGYAGAYNPGYQGSSQQQRDSQARVIQNRRQMDNEAMSRFHNLPVEAVAGQIYDLCKDQHGCRYLQKKLEEQNPAQTHLVWLETNQHVVELMTDPFGNYLCQKLLEFCNNDERTVLIQNAAVDMVRIALNQHGTRALQKMIEFVSTPDQVQIIVEALRNRVVELIQDLNGNHVIQKCLNKLSAADAQFIFDAVGLHCIEVGTHRHGCCVLQRCIDHANADQKAWLIGRITEHAHILVQDPYGNYVIQYIIDLNEPAFTEPVVHQFRGHVSQLSRHKFSSNVIEKCLRCAQDPSKDMIVDEILVPGEIEKLIRDNYANYVIQTALEYATNYKKATLVESIRPVLPSVRSTPYGRRIQAKIHNYDGRTSGQTTPADATGGQIPLRATHTRGLSTGGAGLPTAGSMNFPGLPNGIPGNMNGPSSSASPQRNSQGGFPPSNMMPIGGPPGPRMQPGQFNFPQSPSRTNGNGGPSPSENGEPQWL